MRRIRVIPTLLIKNGGLVKGKQFRNHQYVGDPINAVKIFNDKEVDELSIIDISATQNLRKPDIRQISELASEAFMPLSYGGGITSIDEVDEILYNGIEKVILNTSAINNPKIISEIAKKYGNQSVVISIDVKKSIFGNYVIYSNCGTKKTNLDLFKFIKNCEILGAGEILLTSINNEGTYLGYDFDLIHKLTKILNIPLIANGGAGSVKDFKIAIINGASAVAAGNMFVYQKPHNAVLISYLEQKELNEILDTSN